MYNDWQESILIEFVNLMQKKSLLFIKQQFKDYLNVQYRYI